jgi:hypothetical protein
VSLYFISSPPPALPSVPKTPTLQNYIRAEGHGMYARDHADEVAPPPNGRRVTAMSR